MIQVRLTNRVHLKTRLYGIPVGIGSGFAEKTFEHVIERQARLLQAGALYIHARVVWLKLTWRMASFDHGPRLRFMIVISRLRRERDFFRSTSAYKATCG